MFLFVLLVLPVALKQVRILIPLLFPLPLSGLLSLILLLVLLVFCVHTWNTPFYSITHHPGRKRLSAATQRESLVNAA